MIVVERAHLADAKAVASIVQRVRLPEGYAEPTSSTGFLLTIRTADEYRALIQKTDLFFVAREGGQVVGFLFGMPRIAMGPTGNVYRAILERPETSLVYLDQIGIAPEHHGQGVAARLYEAFVQALHVGTSVYAVIAHGPVRNLRSIGFFQGKQGWRLVGELNDDGRVWGLYQK